MRTAIYGTATMEKKTLQLSKCNIDSVLLILSGAIVRTCLIPYMPTVSINKITEKLGELGYNVKLVNQKLSELGFEEGMSSRNKTFLLHEMLRYTINSDFPRITPESFIGGVLPAGVTGITYTVDLSGMTSESMVQGANHDI